MTFHTLTLPRTGAVFEFTQQSYTILESGGSAAARVRLLESAVNITVKTLDSGTATGESVYSRLHVIGGIGV